MRPLRICIGKRFLDIRLMKQRFVHLLRVERLFPFCNDDCRDCIADNGRDGARFAHEAIDADEQRNRAQRKNAGSALDVPNVIRISVLRWDRIFAGDDCREDTCSHGRR
ncbi:hypothetical protein G3N95_01045 [Paraburkholderia sp. Tr-20389]|uniref:hypothetical protein n=1 Tax=Paraburkholderia sp. Tr-20389 TaxID=2703903 RepID=UPI00197EC159|nr:hypothetical protein [Paraburkholderia sp. Tr-20389]MBN3751511.1 hypothetical protein [Paraburkholderia sp. Tr-20389]